MKKKNPKINQTIYHFVRYAFIFFVITGITCAVIGIIYFSVYESEKKRLVAQQSVAIEVSKEYIEDKIEKEFADLMYIKSWDDLNQYLKDNEDEQKRQSLENDFISFAKEKQDLTQLRVLDVSGMEKVRINKVGDAITVVSKKQLQNKSDRYYFKDALKIKENEMYVSDFDLNIENGKIVVPYEPTIRFAVQLRDDKDQIIGVLIINVDGLKYLKVIQKYKENAQNKEEIGILDSNNFWSLNNTNENNLKNISLIMKENEKDSVSKTFTSEIKQTQKNSGYIETKSKYYTYEHLNLADENRIVFQEKKFKWYVVSYFDKIHSIVMQNTFLRYYWFISFSLSILFTFLFVFVADLYKTRQKSRLQLLATSYIPDNSREGILFTSEDHKIFYCNELFEDIFGWKKQEIINKKVTDFLKLDFQPQKMKSENCIYKGNIWEFTKEKTLIRKYLTVNVVYGKNHKIEYYIYIFSNPFHVICDIGFDEDIPMFSIGKDEIYFLGNYMNTMEIKENTIMLSMQIVNSIKNLFEMNQGVQGEFIHGIERFVKDIAGLDLIAVPRHDVIIFLLEYQTNLAEEISMDDFVSKTAIQIKNRLLELNFILNQEQVDFQMVFGASYFYQHGKEAKEVLKNSLIAIEMLLRMKKNRFLVFDYKFNSMIFEERKIQYYLKKAFENDEFYVVYQPQFEVKTNKISGMEALVRWNSPILGKLKPERFMDILLNMEEIQKLGVYVFQEVCKDIKTLEKYDRNINVSINLSSHEFSDETVLCQFREKKQQMEQENIHFCIEITETTIIENLEKANQFVEAYHDESFDMSIDDFGTGYSSLSYLKELMADELKIDRVFIKGYPNSDDGKLIKAIVGLAKEMNLRIVVEGVETKEQYDYIKSLDCDIYQGYYGGKPMQIEELEEYFKEYYDN